VPVFILILALTVDVSMIFLGQSNLWRATRDTARQISIGKLTTIASAAAYAEDKGTFSGVKPVAVVVLDRLNGLTTVQLTTSIRDVSVFGVLNVGGVGNLVAKTTSFMERN